GLAREQSVVWCRRAIESLRVGKSSCGNGFVPCGGFCVSTRIGPFVNYPGLDTESSRWFVADARQRRFVVVCWRLDRLGRNLKHLITLLEETPGARRRVRQPG